jgi:membrane protein implicated in regulation of membrane protease activity
VDAELVWLVLGAVLIVVEVLTLTLALGMLGVAALLTAGVAVLGGGLVLQSLTFGAASLGLLVFARPPVQRMLTSRDDGSTDARALSGSTALVVERVTDDSGQVRLNGELWRARPYAGGGPVDAGREVSVAAVEGATLLVYSPDLS